MRALYWTFTSLVLAAAAACASSEDKPLPAQSSDTDSGANIVQDASPEDPAASDAAPDATTCSPAGWCPTSLPDVDLTFKDIWSLPGHAFAVAESPTVGSKALEWSESDQTWSYIDDASQNQAGKGNYVGRIWAPSEDEVYFTVAPRTIYHGNRTADASKPWSWTHQQLENRIPTNYTPSTFNPEHYTGRPTDLATATVLVSLGVFGTGPDDVYAWYGNAIYHLTTDESGDPTWAVDYVADDLDRADEQLFFLGATGTSRDDLWFGGARTGNVYEGRTCAMAVHKTAAGYRRVVDGMGVGYGCQPRGDGGTIVADGAVGFFTDIRADSANSVIGLKGGQTVARVSRVSADGDAYSISLSEIPLLAPQASTQFMFLSLSAAPDDMFWLGGFSLVAQGKDAWDTDGGSYGISTISLNGSFTKMTVYQIRASSNTDVWAVGDRNALHKTTP